MKKLLNIYLLLLSLVFFSGVSAQDEEPELLLSLSYYVEPSGIQYLKVNTRTKENNKLVNVAGAKVTVYMDSIASENIIGQIVTPDNGEGNIFIPSRFKEQWKQTSEHIFKAVSDPINKMGEATTELSIVTGKIEIDTLSEDGIRNVKVKVLKLEGAEWVPASDVEMKIAVRRYGGELPVGEEESYTTDSLGEAIAEFKRDSLPADSLQNIELVARISDNESLGNLYVVKTVPWGVQVAKDKLDRSRTLWATRDRAPYWLLFMAYFIIAIVWGTLMYLIYILVRIVRNRDLSKEPQIRRETESVLT